MSPQSLKKLSDFSSNLLSHVKNYYNTSLWPSISPEADKRTKSTSANNSPVTAAEDSPPPLSAPDSVTASQSTLTPAAGIEKMQVAEKPEAAEKPDVAPVASAVEPKSASVKASMYCCCVAVKGLIPSNNLISDASFKHRSIQVFHSLTYSN